MLVRGGTLTETMSDYLIRQIESTPNITVHYQTETLDGHGTDQLIGLTLQDQRSGHTRQVPADALFILIGAEPHTQWLPDSISRDQQGFILTGPDLGEHNPPPSLFETSLPGVFAIGDVRHGSVKRVANAVGEASVAVRSEDDGSTGALPGAIQCEHQVVIVHP